MTKPTDIPSDLELREARLTAFALGQLTKAQAIEVEQEIAADESVRQTVRELQQLGVALKAVAALDLPDESSELRDAVARRLKGENPATSAAPKRQSSRFARRGWLALAGCAAVVTIAVFGWPRIQRSVSRSIALRSSEDSRRMADASKDGGRNLEEQLREPSQFTSAAPAPGHNVSDFAEALSRPRFAGAASRHDSTRSMESKEIQPASPASTSYDLDLDGRFDTLHRLPAPGEAPRDEFGRGISSEQYDQIHENSFLPVDRQHARSTFSIDVDTASYTNIRRFLNEGRLPPKNAVRIEEMVNYFKYDYPTPGMELPFSVNMEVAECPWRPEHRLLRIGLKGYEVDARERPASNLVFLLDVSGSMNASNKLPLLKEAMKLLIGQLDENDRVTIVTYAGRAGLVLDTTSGDETIQLREAVDGLNAGGSTNGSAGITLAYEKALEHFIEDGTNRVILATDGDLNVGITRDDDLVELIRDKAASGVFLSVLGFGTGNLKDSKMEKLADNGNGNYAYIDSLREARKVLVEQISGSLVTIAKDVKLQLEFNPLEVQAYRLIGYENRVLAREDFDDDTKDAGEIGAGHTVTALYELIPVGVEPAADDTAAELKYQGTSKPEAEPKDVKEAAESGELLTLWLRYKQPEGDTSRRVEFTAKDAGTKFNRASRDFQFSASVAAFGMMLRDSKYRGGLSYSAIEEMASSAIGKDPGGYRAEFLDLVRRAASVPR